LADNNEAAKKKHRKAFLNLWLDGLVKEDYRPTFGDLQIIDEIRAGI